MQAASCADAAVRAAGDKPQPRSPRRTLVVAPFVKRVRSTITSALPAARDSGSRQIQVAPPTESRIVLIQMQNRANLRGVSDAGNLEGQSIFSREWLWFE